MRGSSPLLPYQNLLVVGLYIQPAVTSILFLHRIFNSSRGILVIRSFNFSFIVYHSILSAGRLYSIFTTAITMYTSISILALAALLPSVQSHGVILSAVGDSGASQGFLGKLKNELSYEETTDLHSCS